MVNYNKLLSEIKSQKKELKEQRTFTPSQLSSSKKKYEKYKIGNEISGLNEKNKELKKEQKKSDSSRKKFLNTIDKLARQRITSKRILKQERPTLTIKERKVESSWNEPSLFFKSELNFLGRAD